MQIPYVTRSKFLAPCEVSIKENLQNLNDKKIIFVYLENGGYNADIDVEILQNSNTFNADYNGDASRFPARVKAAATALKNQKSYGSYNISHDDGLLSIKKIN